MNWRYFMGALKTNHHVTSWLPFLTPAGGVGRREVKRRRGRGESQRVVRRGGGGGGGGWVLKNVQVCYPHANSSERYSIFKKNI